MDGKLNITLEPKSVQMMSVKESKAMLNAKFKKNKMKELIMTEQNLRGVQETVDVLEFGVALVNTVHDVTAEDSASGKKIAMTEYPSFFPLLFKVGPMITGIQEVPAELVDKITNEEKEKMKSVIKKVKALQEDADLDQAVEDFLEWALTTKHLITKYILKK